MATRRSSAQYYCLMKSEITTLQNDMGTVIKDLQGTKETLAKVSEDTKDIRRALLGDDYFENGVLHQVKSHAEEIQTLKNESSQLQNSVANYPDVDKRIKRLETVLYTGTGVILTLGFLLKFGKNIFEFIKTLFTNL
jgi:hypothetical protein